MTSSKSNKTRQEDPCSKEDILNHLIENNTKLNIIITGNGNPEKGLMRQVALSIEKQNQVTEKLTEIHDSLKEYRAEVKEAREIAYTAQNAIERYKIETEGFEKGEESVNTARQMALNRITMIVTTIVVVLGLGVSIWVGIKGDRKSDTLINRVDDLGVPVIVNPRGIASPLPKGDELKFFPKDFMGDTTAKDTAKNKEVKP